MKNSEGTEKPVCNKPNAIELRTRGKFYTTVNIPDLFFVSCFLIVSFFGGSHVPEPAWRQLAPFGLTG